MRLYKSLIFTLAWVCFFSEAFAQTGVLINSTTGTPDGSAMLEVRSTQQGFLPPRLTLSQRNAITSPATGLMIYQKDNTPGYYYNSGTPASPVWERLMNGSGTVVTGSGVANQVTYWSGTNTITGDAGFTYDGTDLTLSSDGNIVMPSNTSEIQFSGGTGPHGLNFVNGEAVFYYRTSPNLLLIEDASTNPIFSADIDDQQVGIGIDEPEDKLHVVGSIRMVDGNQSIGYLPVSDANGTMTWTDPTTITTADDGDWTVSGSDIKRTSGNVYIGNASTTNNDLYLSDDLIDWDNTAYSIDMADVSRMDEVEFDAGSVTDPSIYFEGNTNTGLFEAADDNIGFTIAGSEAMRIDDNSDVGIGTTSPQGKLEVTGDIWSTLSSDNSLRIRPGLGAGNQYGFTDNYGNTMALVNEQGGTNQAIILGDSDDDDATTLFGVAVGTSVSDPSTGAEAGWEPRFEIAGSGLVKFNTYTTDGLLATGGGDGTIRIATGADVPSGSDDYIQNQNSADQTADFRISGNGLFNGGNVGIGTTSPANLLHIYGTPSTLARFEQSTTSGANANIEIKGARNACTTCEIAGIDLRNYDSNDGGGVEYIMARIFGGMDANDGSKGYLSLMTNPGSGVVERMRINEAGIVGINVTSPGVTPSSDGQTSTPNLHILNTESMTGTAEVLRLERYSGSDIQAASAGHIGFYLNDNNAGGGEVARISWQDGQSGNSDNEGTGELHFWTSETESTNGVPVQRMTINKLGNVGIGTTNPSAFLHIKSTNSGNGGFSESGIVVENTASGSEAAISFINGNSGSNYFMTGLNESEHYDIAYGTTFTNANTHIRVQSGGNVGIGTISPDALLNVDGDAHIEGYTYVDGNLKVSGVNSKVQFNTKEANNGWTLIYRDDFESGDDGWAMFENNNSGTIASGEYERENFGIVGISTNMNNHSGGTSDDSDNNNVFKKLYDMSGITWTEAQITFDYLFIDSWDSRERGYAGVASSLTANPTILWVENHDNNDDANGRIAYSFAGSSEGDHIRTATLHVHNNVMSSDNFILIIGSTLDEDRDNESFGIDNVEVWVR